ncbi:MAG: S1 RNA-binding domain-containing protein [Clostridia bacterium]|nr:S1 RNA-binding domain-containing protein [Clostridia bacterium]
MQVKEGDILVGRISGLTGFGAFVDIGEGKSGMIHISEASVGFVEKIEDVFKVGQEVRAVVIGINEQGKISLSSKRALKAENDNSSSDEEKTEREEKRERRSAPNVWTGPKQKQASGGSFEDMMAQFKKQSEEKMADLKRANNTGHSGYSRRGGGR